VTLPPLKPLTKLNRIFFMCANSTQGGLSPRGVRMVRGEVGNGLSETLSEQLLLALKSLSSGYMPHDCGGFTTDDMEWRLGIAFTGER
jgi:hypothetical protein